jgi:hypothetical protein
MSTIVIFLTQIVLTVIACLLIAGYIRPFLKRVLVMSLVAIGGAVSVFALFAPRPKVNG